MDTTAMRTRILVAALLAGVALTALPARAQTLSLPADEFDTGVRTLGWSWSPAIDYAVVWDSNVLFDNKGDVLQDETLHMLRPRAVLDFRGRRSTFGADYRGSFVHHPELRSLNSYDQRLAVTADRKVTRRATWVGRYGFTASPTTELAELPGVPYERTGSTLHDASSGVDYALSRRATIGGRYRFEHVTFDRDPTVGTPLVGGFSHGGTGSVAYALGERTAISGDYTIQFASLRNRDDFHVQTAWAGIEHQLSEVLRVFAHGGLSRLSAVGIRAPRTGPAARVGLTRDFRRAGFSLLYNRSYVPSYGFGGTMQNEELSTRLLVPLSPRLYAHANASWRRNEPLDTADLALRSTWFGGGVGYTVLPWMRLEAYSAATRQNINRPGGELSHYQFGLQVTAAKTTRIR